MGYGGEWPIVQARRWLIHSDVVGVFWRCCLVAVLISQIVVFAQCDHILKSANSLPFHVGMMGRGGIPYGGEIWNHGGVICCG